MERVEVGLLRQELSKDLVDTLEVILDRFANREQPYFVHVYSEMGLDVYSADAMAPQGKVMEVDGKTVIRTKFLVTDRIGPMMLGTMCFKVDNRKGQLSRIWVLPQNDPDVGGIEREDRIVEEVLSSALKVGPVIH